jgi:multicomponent Na+:H+ antiporter subunit B
MNSVILQIASKYIRLILLVFAVLALLRGHNHPGGGFIGGLLGGLAYVFSAFAYSDDYVRDRLFLRPSFMVAIGLAIVLLSMTAPLLADAEIMRGLWMEIRLPLELKLKLGTPLLFDLGVFLTVMGVSLLFLLNLDIR